MTALSFWKSGLLCYRSYLNTRILYLPGSLFLSYKS